MTVNLIPVGPGTIKLKFEKRQGIFRLKSPTELQLKKVVNDPNVDGYIEVVAISGPELERVPPYMLAREFSYFILIGESHQTDPNEYVDSFFVNDYQTPGFGVLTNYFDAAISLSYRPMDMSCNVDEIPDALYVEPAD